MLGDKIYLLRKNIKISQEEFAEILNTSRQAVSKWERNESKPDIDKLILIAKLFNISIDYLLSYEINYSNIKEFIKKLKDSCLNNEYRINIEDVRFWCLKHPNNFELHLYSSEYLYASFINNNNEEYLNLALSCINKAIILFTPEYNEIINLNELHSGVSEIYLMQEKYELAREYVEKNNVHGCEVLLAKCDFSLNQYENALKRSSEIYLKSASDIMNVSFIQTMILLKLNKVHEAYDLVNWSILFINSIQQDYDFFQNVLCPFIYLKATCEKLLNYCSEESIKTLKDIFSNSLNRTVAPKSNSIKYYFGKTNPILLVDSNIKNIFKEIIKQTSKKDIHYQTLLNIYEEIVGENDYE